MPAPLSLIFRADDAGVNESTTRAIVKTALHGPVRNVGIMVPPVSHPDALAPLRDLPDSVALGLHATIHCEWEGQRWCPVSPPKSVASLLESDGSFLRSPQQTKERSNPDEVVREVQAQLDRLRLWGFPPSYLDAHMVWTWIPPLGERIAALCEREGLVFANQASAFPCLARIESAPADPMENLLARIRATPGPIAFCLFHPCEPGPDTAGMWMPDRPAAAVVEARSRETQLLCDPAFHLALQQLGVQSITYPEATRLSF